jgi:hypothetical protein
VDQKSFCLYSHLLPLTGQSKDWQYSTWAREIAGFKPETAGLQSSVATNSNEPPLLVRAIITPYEPPQLPDDDDVDL